MCHLNAISDVTAFLKFPNFDSKIYSESKRHGKNYFIDITINNK